MFIRATSELLKNAATKLICGDIGSAGGFHVRFDAIREDISIIGFDADKDECERLRKTARPGDHFVHSAIGIDGKEIIIELHKKRQTSSIYATDFARLKHYPDSDRYQTEVAIKLTTTSLDSICKAHHIPWFDYLKIDAEGHELAILQGYSAPMMMAEIEINFHSFRKGIPLFNEIMTHMLSRGFILADLRRTFWNPSRANDLKGYDSKGFLFFGDALFVLDPFSEKTIELLSIREARAKYLALLCLYGYAAEAFMFLDILEESGKVELTEIRVNAAIIKKCCSQLPKVRLKGFGRVMLPVERVVRFPFSIRSGLQMGMDSQADREVGNWR